MIAIILMVLATITGAYGSFYMKKGAAKLNKNILEQIKNIPLIIGFSLMGLGALLTIIALRFGDLSVLYPITSLTYIWIVFLSMKYLKEKMNFYKWTGIVLIMVGVVLVTA